MVVRISLHLSLQPVSLHHVYSHVCASGCCCFSGGTLTAWVIVTRHSRGPPSDFSKEGTLHHVCLHMFEYHRHCSIWEQSPTPPGVLHSEAGAAPTPLTLHNTSALGSLCPKPCLPQTSPTGQSPGPGGRSFFPGRQTLLLPQPPAWTQCLRVLVLCEWGL